MRQNEGKKRGKKKEKKEKKKGPKENLMKNMRVMGKRFIFGQFSLRSVDSI